MTSPTATSRTLSDAIPYALKRRTNEATHLARTGRVGTLLSYLLAGVTRRDVVGAYLRRRYSPGPNGLVRERIGTHWMLLDPTDPGISRTLLAYGTHESGPARRYFTALRRAAGTVSAPRVIDIGANLGYYTLGATEAIGPAGHLSAIEPEPRNRSILRKNVAINGYEDRVTIEDMAIGGHNGTEHLGISEHSNLNRLITEGGAPSRDSGEVIDVDVRTVDAYLRSRDLDPASIVGVRMDLEGHESRVFEGMDRVLTAPGPLVIYAEIHPWVLGERHGELLERLSTCGFSLLTAERGIVTDRPCSMTIRRDRLTALADIPYAYALLVAK